MGDAECRHVLRASDWRICGPLEGTMPRDQRCRDAAMHILSDDAVVLSFGWNTVGMGKTRGFEIVEIMLVCHGGAHNDTICLAERRLPQEATLL